MLLLTLVYGVQLPGAGILQEGTESTEKRLYRPVSVFADSIRLLIWAKYRQ
jgi:hypothetical protein